MSDTAEAGVIVYQSGSAVLGVGVTLQEALANAGRSTDADAEEELGRGEGVNEEYGRMYYSPATQRLIDRVRKVGGQIDFQHRNGVADLPAEA